MLADEILKVADAGRKRALALLSQVADQEGSGESSDRLAEAAAQLRSTIVVQSGFATARDQEPGEDESVLRPIARELSDAYGMLGEVLRRQGRIDEAIQQYEQNHLYETERYGIVGSENLTNWLILSLYQDPDAYEEKRQNLLKAVQHVHRQSYGRRRDEWWAWADLGLLRLLLSDRLPPGIDGIEPSPRAWEAPSDRFGRADPTAQRT